MSQVLGAFGLMDFSMLRPVLAWRVFWNLWTDYFFNFHFFSRAAVNRGLLKSPIWISRYGGTTIYIFTLPWKVSFPHSWQLIVLSVLRSTYTVEMNTASTSPTITVNLCGLLGDEKLLVKVIQCFVMRYDAFGRQFKAWSCSLYGTQKMRADNILPQLWTQTMSSDDVTSRTFPPIS
jgi:hypothetical protein